MGLKLPGVDIKFLTNVVVRLNERRLHAYYPGSRRSAAALILRFDDATQRTLMETIATFQAISRRHLRHEGLNRDPPFSSSGSASTTTTTTNSSNGSSSNKNYHSKSGKNTQLDLLEFLQYLQNFCVDAEAPSALQLLFLRRTDLDASRWSGQVVFPGGRRDPEDADDFQTVCRETYEDLGLPLQHHREFVCLGRLPDCKLRSRAANTSGVVQARFVFLHVGEMSPTVRIATHAVASARWVPLSRLTSAHVEHGCVVHPLQSFVHPQDADYRLLLTELFPSTYLSFPSVSLPFAEGEEHTNLFTENRDATATSSMTTAPSPSSRTWRVWGLTLRSANELLALDNRQPFDWPLVESNSRVLQYCVLFPFHGYYELLFQYFLLCARLAARRRVFFNRFSFLRYPDDSILIGKDRRVLYSSAMERRNAALPVSADALLFAAPEEPVIEHVLCFLFVVALVALVLYAVASVIADLFTFVGLTLGAEAALEREERRRIYYDSNLQGSVNKAKKMPAHMREDGFLSLSAKRESGAGELKVSASYNSPAASSTVASASPAVGEEVANGKDKISTSTAFSTSWWWGGGFRASPGSHGAPDEIALASESGIVDDQSDPYVPAASYDSSATSTIKCISKSAVVAYSVADSTTELHSSLGEFLDASNSATASVQQDEGASSQIATPIAGPSSGDESAMHRESVTSAPPQSSSGSDTAVDTHDEAQPTPPTAAADVVEAHYEDELQSVMNRYRSS